MSRIVLLTCMVGLTLLLPSAAFADDPDSCDMMCRLKSYLATDHMIPVPEAAAGRAGAAKHARSAAAAHHRKAVVAAAPAPTAPQAVEPRPVPAAPKAALARPGRPAAVAVAAGKPLPSPEHHRPTAKIASRPDRTTLASRAEAEPRQPETRPVATEPAPRRAATRLATLAAGRSTARTPAPAPAETTTSSAATIPGSAPLVAPGFR